MGGHHHPHHHYNKSGSDSDSNERRHHTHHYRESGDSESKTYHHHHHHYHYHYYESSDSMSCDGQPKPPPPLPHKPAYRVFCLARSNYSLAINDGKVILAPSNSSDPSQQWYKEEKLGASVRDESGRRSFSLVNKHTGQAIQHPAKAHQSVRLLHYDPDFLNRSVLWSAHDLVGDGFAAIRMVDNIALNMDAIRTEDGNGYVHYGKRIGVWEWKKGDNQRWKLAPI